MRVVCPIAVQLLSRVQIFETPWIAVWQGSFTVSWSLLKLISIESTERMPSNHLMLCCSLLLTSVFPSIRVFSSELALHIRWPKYWSFCFSISPSNEHLGLISCRIDWFDLLAIQETLKRLLQHHNLKASILWHSVFFTSNSHIHIWLLVKLWLWLYRHLLAKWCLWFLIRFLIFS